MTQLFKFAIPIVLPLTLISIYIAIKSQARAIPEDHPQGMVWIASGSYLRGCDRCDLADTRPVHRVHVDGFWIHETPVTNAEFGRFVKQTGYITIAEKAPDPKDFPGVPKEKLVAGYAVFSPPSHSVSLERPYSWWRYQPGANWKKPEGSESDIQKRMDHPAVHIAFADAEAYCKWRRQRLPTEAEFEFAARGGLENKKYSWGDELKPNGRWLANIWQGHFPIKNEAEDGFHGTSPVRTFPPNGFGLYDVSGNVWQWTSDWYRPDTYQKLVDAGGEIRNPQGPTESFDTEEPGVPKRVQRGGSFLCSSKYCTRYLVASRGKGEPGSSGSNIGFRCVQTSLSQHTNHIPKGGIENENLQVQQQIQGTNHGLASGGASRACHGRLPGKDRLVTRSQETQHSLRSSR